MIIGKLGLGLRFGFIQGARNFARGGYLADFGVRTALRPFLSSASYLFMETSSGLRRTK